MINASERGFPEYSEVVNEGYYMSDGNLEVQEINLRIAYSEGESDGYRRGIHLVVVRNHSPQTQVGYRLRNETNSLYLYCERFLRIENLVFQHVHNNPAIDEDKGDPIGNLHRFLILIGKQYNAEICYYVNKMVKQ